MSHQLALKLDTQRTFFKYTAFAFDWYSVRALAYDRLDFSNQINGTKPLIGSFIQDYDGRASKLPGPYATYLSEEVCQ
jgi:hypothetical protein